METYGSLNQMIRNKPHLHILIYKEHGGSEDMEGNS